MKPKLSVITCTYNPRRDYLARTLEGLRLQTVPVTDWEYILVDNNSSEPVSVDLDWHPQARLLREPKPGKVHALLRALEEVRGELIVIVDDDNVLASDYLEKALEIGETKPFLGVWGGQIFPEFEVPPPEWSQPYLYYLTLKTYQREEWSNLHGSDAPAGAGMCLRAFVARKFAQNVAEHPERLQLGRTGSSVLTGEDWEMALAACDLGLGMGHFPQLRLTHLIPKSRLELNYLLHLVEAMIFSRHVFIYTRALHNRQYYIPTRFQRVVRWLALWRTDPIRRKFLQAEYRAQDSAIQVFTGKSLDRYADTEKIKAEQTGVRAR